MNLRAGLGWCLIGALALALRLVALDERPMHNDEGLNAIKLRTLFEAGTYRYDPREFHGPTLYYFSLPFLRLSGATAFAQISEKTLRMATVFLGFALVLLPLLLFDGLGKTGALAAGTLTAISPAMVFYSRYYIHEMLLVALTLLLLGAGWRYWITRRIGWAVIAGLAMGLMHATKETFVFSLLALAGAYVLTWVWNRFKEKQRVPVLPRIKWPHLLAGMLVASVVSITLFTSFFSNPGGPLDSLRTYVPWLTRAGGESPHIHPWAFYFERLFWFHQGRGPVWTEAATLILALIGFGSALRGQPPAGGHTNCLRFLGFYTVVLTAIYSFIPYKTPWCALSFLNGWILLGGAGVAVIWRWCRKPAAKAIAGIGLVVLAGHLIWQAWNLNQNYSADRRNPWVYAHTSPDLLKLVDRVHKLAAVHPDSSNVLIKVIVANDDYWPLPWYLRQYKRVGWWPSMPDDPDAPIVISDPATSEEFDVSFKASHFAAGYFSLRPRVFLELHVATNLWQNYMKAKAGTAVDESAAPSVK